MWFWEKLGRIPFQLLDKITPKIVHEYLGKFLDELGSYIQTGGQYLIKQQDVLDRLQEKSAYPEKLTIEKVRELPLETMNELSEEYKKSRKHLATLQGATTGFGGIFTLAVDIPVLLGLSLKVLQEMAVTYGYDPTDQAERIFIVKCLQFSSSDYNGKQSILKELTGTAEEPAESISRLQGWREVIMTYRDNYGWKKLFQIIPGIGILFGAIINRSTIEEVAEAGQMLYRKRRVLSKIRAVEEEKAQEALLEQGRENTTPLN